MRWHCSIPLVLKLKPWPKWRTFDDSLSLTNDNFLQPKFHPIASEHGIFLYCFLFRSYQVPNRSKSKSKGKGLHQIYIHPSCSCKFYVFIWIVKKQVSGKREWEWELHGGKRQQQQKLGFIWCTMAIEQNHRQILWHSFGFFLTVFFSLFLSDWCTYKHFHTHTQTKKAHTNSCVTWVSMKQWFPSFQAYQTSNRTIAPAAATTTNNWDANKKNMPSLRNFQMILSRIVNVSTHWLNHTHTPRVLCCIFFLLWPPSILCL